MISSRIIFIFSFLLLVTGNTHINAQAPNTELISILTAGVPPLSIYPKLNVKSIENKAASFEHIYSKTYDWNFSERSTLNPVSKAIIPQYVKENPRGYSYLCRLELKVEEKLPVGVWIKLGERNGLKGVVSSPTNVRMKLLSF